MKTKNKKYIFLVITLTCFLMLNKKCKAVSNEFKFVIDTIGIPQYNVYGDEINEEIYYTYNIFVYSNPIAMFSKSASQRFKLVANNGKWTNGGGKYNGSGERGEYYLLGTSYSGSSIANVVFPVDSTPEVTPDKWNYIAFDGAYSSWFDTSKYKYTEQNEYMKTTQLLFDEINYSNNTCNSYNLVEYGITSSLIGLNKVLLNTSSTWKTNGVVTVKRKNNRGEIRYATLATKPMAAQADIRSKLDIKDEYKMSDYEDRISIPISYGANAINLNSYAKPIHIKEICSVIYIDGKEVSRISGSKTVDITKTYNYTVPRDNKNQSITTSKNKESVKIVDVKVVSYLYTEFCVDGLMQNTIQKRFTILIPNVTINPVNSATLKILKKENNTLVVSPLIKTIETEKLKSCGIIETGKYLAIKIKLNLDSSKIKSFCTYINENEVKNEVIYSNDKEAIIKLKVDENLSNTLASWNYLREKVSNYFNINYRDIGIRIKEPNILKIKISTNEDEEATLLNFDSIDNYKINMNYIFDKGVLNKNEIEINEKLEEWK